MKEDILEQLVDDYLQSLGYFTRHNIKFRPSKDGTNYVGKQDANHSDIDVLGFNPNLYGAEQVMAVSCKSWQSGFSVKRWLNRLTDENKIVKVSGKNPWKFFRELMLQKWSDAFVAEIKSATGSSAFTYVTAVTAIKGDRELWEKHTRFQDAMRGNPIKLLSLSEMVDTMSKEIRTTLASSSLGRTLQLLKASGYSFEIDKVRKRH